MLSTTERNNLILAIRDLPQHLETAVQGLSEEQLDTRYREGGWTLRQVTHHIADSHLNAFIRMKLVIVEEHPTLKPYSQDDWAELPDARNFPIQSSLDIIRGVHQRMTQLLQNASEDSWSKTAFHPENGEVSLEDLLKTYSRHGNNHVNQILTLRKERNW